MLGQALNDLPEFTTAGREHMLALWGFDGGLTAAGLHEAGHTAAALYGWRIERVDITGDDRAGVTRLGPTPDVTSPQKLRHIRVALAGEATERIFGFPEGDGSRIDWLTAWSMAGTLAPNKACRHALLEQ